MLKKNLNRMIAIIVFFFSFQGCSVSQPELDSYMNKNGDTINIDIPYQVIPQLKYDESSKPVVVCIREIYAHKLFESKLHFEHVFLREYYGNVEGISKDSLDVYSDLELENTVTNLFVPLFPGGKDLPSGVESKKGEPFNKHLLKENLQIKFIQKVEDEMNLATVIEDGKFKWYLRKDEGKWKIFKGHSF